jgi:GntR family transcriptional regulator, rspAB operon transcriptional repressor
VLRDKTSPAKSLIDLDPAVTPPAALTDRIYATLKHRILTCVMMPRARIVEKDLCAEMGVSRTPLREALNRLSLEGLVSILPFRGYIVAPLTVEGFRELCELRRILEPEAAALCAERATDAEIARLDGLAEVRYRREDRRTYEKYLRANSAFHQTLVQGTHNARLETMVMLALDQHDRSLYLGLGIGMDVQPSAVEHRRIVEVIGARDPGQARSVMREHIMRGEHRIATALEAGGY